MSLHDRIKEARIKKGLTQEQLGQLVGVAKTTITGYEKNREPTAAKVGEIADALNVDVNFLYQDEVKERKENHVSLDELTMIKKYRNLDDTGKNHIDYELDRECKRIEEIRKHKQYIESLKAEIFSESFPTRIWAYYGKIASAGTSVEFTDMVAGTKKYPVTEENKNADYTIGVNGDSMEPLYNDGDVVFVKHTIHLHIGDIGIFQKDNNIYIKQVGEGCLVSLNPNYDPIKISDGIRVWGKVLGKAVKQD